MYSERQVEHKIDEILKEKGWILDATNSNKNVYFQTPKPEHKKLLGRYRPDYTLYSNNQPIGIIEVKKAGADLDKAIQQATLYAELLGAPLIFASNGSYVETRHLKTHKPLRINGEFVHKLLDVNLANKFIENKTDAIITESIKIIKSKEQLIPIFKNVNNLLRDAHVLSGYDRINVFSTFLFLKIFFEKDQTKDNVWNDLKNFKNDTDALDFLNNCALLKLDEKYKNSQSGGGVHYSIR